MNKLSKTREEKLCFSLLIFLVLIKIVLIHPTFSDDIFYFNVAKSILSGLTPYRDFFFAHPPLHEYLLALLFALFGPSIFIGKLLAALSSLASGLLIYYIGRKFFEREREEIAIYSVLFFLFSPVFLAYSSIGYGMWEAMFFLLLSIYFLLNGRRVLPGLFFSIAFFIRYLVSLYLPLLFIFSKLKRRPFFGFLWWFIIFTICIFFTLLLLFGYNFINQTFCFHLYSKVGVAPSEQVFLYLRMNLFFVLVSLLTIFLAGPTKYKDKAVILSISLLSIDFLIFLIFRQPFFHYFILSLPFYSLLSGRLLSDASFSAKSLMIVAFLIYIFGNSSTLNFYLNPSYSSAFYQIEKIVENYTTTDSTIFGEPIMANYISLSLDRRIVNNYLDSYPQHLGLEKEHIQGVLKRQTPDLFIDLKVGNFSYSTVLGLRNYVSESYRKVGEIRIKSLTYEIFVLQSKI